MCYRIVGKELRLWSKGSKTPFPLQSLCLCGEILAVPARNEGESIMKHIDVILPILALSSFLFQTECYGSSNISEKTQQIQNLRAFARLYGYIKYFHPSDEASSIDWNKLAVFGAGKVKNAKDTAELKEALKEIFLPIAPTAQIYGSDEEPIALELPENVEDLKVVSWQHQGLGFGTSGQSIYKSIRLNREKSQFGTIVQAVDGAKYCGRGIRLKASVRTDVSGPGNQGQLWLRVDRANGKTGFFNNMRDRPIKSRDWGEYEITGTVDEDASRIVFGCFLLGYGKVWVDGFQLLIENDSDEWEPIELKNPGFEKGVEGGKPEPWIADSPGYSFKLSTDSPYEGEKCLLIQDEPSGKLFEKQAEAGEVFHKELDSGLFCQVPLALYSDENNTLGKNDEYPFESLSRELDKIDLDEMTSDDENVRLADVVIAWNVFQHFYPYFDVVDVDWDAELTNTLEEALKNEKEFLYTLKKLIAKLQDGHAKVLYSKNAQGNEAGLPILVDWIENQVVITATEDEDRFRRGDIILSIGGVDARKELQNREEYISGSPQWKRYNALRQWGYGVKGSIVRLSLRRGDETIDIDAERNFTESIEEFQRPKIEELEDDIYYVNLDQAKMSEINEKMDEIAKAKGAIFDLRGYPKGNHNVICHLLKEKDISKAWMRVPQIIYPDHENLAGFAEFGWVLEPAEPHIDGNVVFITDGRAISYAESFMGFIEHYKLAEIVGQPTAGTNGNANTFELPGGFRIRWTGMKVVKHDGSQHHLIGILPTLPVERTIKGVTEGRDEFLESAIEVVNR